MYALNPIISKIEVHKPLQSMGREATIEIGRVNLV